MLSRLDVREVRLQPSEFSLAPEKLAEMTPFILKSPAEIARGRVTGWLRTFLGVRSVPAHWVRGEWAHQEHWIWLHRDAASTCMAGERTRGSSVAVMEVWLPVRRAGKS